MARLAQLLLVLGVQPPRLVGSQQQAGDRDPPRPGNLTECMNWYEGQCSTCRCSTLFAMGYTCESFAPGTEFQACEQPRSARVSVSLGRARQSSAESSEMRAACCPFACRLRCKLPVRSVLCIHQRNRARRCAYFQSSPARCCCC